jgi:putative transposase
MPVHVPPTAALAKVVNSLKGVSSRRRRQEFPDLAALLAGAEAPAGVLFRRFRRGAPLYAVKQYIVNRNRPPRSP